MNDKELIKQLLGAALDIIISSTIFVVPLITIIPRFYLACFIELLWMALNMANTYNCIKLYDVDYRETYIMGFCSAMASVFTIALLFFGILYDN